MMEVLMAVNAPPTNVLCVGVTMQQRTELYTFYKIQKNNSAKKNEVILNGICLDIFDN